MVWDAPLQLAASAGSGRSGTGNTPLAQPARTVSAIARRRAAGRDGPADRRPRPSGLTTVVYPSSPAASRTLVALDAYVSGPIGSADGTFG